MARCCKQGNEILRFIKCEEVVCQAGICNVESIGLEGSECVLN